VLASLDKTTLPQNVILAQADLVDAQRTLKDLQTSGTRGAEARQKLEEAQQALEDGRDPAGIQAEALQKVAEAQKALELAQDNYEIIAKPPLRKRLPSRKPTCRSPKKLSTTPSKILNASTRSCANPKALIYSSRAGIFINRFWMAGEQARAPISASTRMHLTGITTW